MIAAPSPPSAHGPLPPPPQAVEWGGLGWGTSRRALATLFSPIDAAPTPTLPTLGSLRSPGGRGHPQSGFTLIELLVGLFLFGVMAAAGTVLLGSAVQAGDVSRTLLNDAQAQIRLRALLSADTSQAAPRPWRDGEGRTHAAFSANDGALFTLIRRGWRNPDGAARASLQRVSWILENGNLIRRAASMLDGDAPPTETILASGITSARLRLLGPSGWRETWAGASLTELPRAVELTLEGEEIGQIRHVLLVGPA